MASYSKGYRGVTDKMQACIDAMKEHGSLVHEGGNAWRAIGKEGHSAETFHSSTVQGLNYRGYLEVKAVYGDFNRPGVYELSEREEA